MRNILALALISTALAACGGGGTNKTSPAEQKTAQPKLSVPKGAQSVNIATDPATVRATLVSSAAQRGTIVVQNQPNMVVMERAIREANPALDAEFGPSDNGDRIIRVRVRFQGSGCQTFAVQDLAIINNARTALAQSYALPGNPNTMESLVGLKTKAEGRGCASS